MSDTHPPTPNPIQSPYLVLGLQPHATAAEIKQAYFALVRTYPPEREPERFKQIRAAYERLRDPKSRLETDMQLLRNWEPPAKLPRLTVPQMQVEVTVADILRVAQGFSDLGRSDWREHYRKVLP